MSKNISRLSARKGLENNLFERLLVLDGQDSQAIGAVAEEFLVGSSTVFGSTTFYELLQQENRHRRAFVCNGSACLCADATGSLQKQLDAHLPAEQLGTITCLGHCYEGGAFQLDGINYGGNSIDQLQELLQGNTGQAVAPYPVVALGGKELLTGKYDLENFQRDLEVMLAMTPETVLAEVKASKLRGRGGAGFPIGMKWQTCRDASPSGKDGCRYVVCNADEGDPGAFSDRYLLEQQCLKVIFGMLAAGYAADAAAGIIYIRAEYPQAIDNCLEIIELLASRNLLGAHILDSGFSFSLKIIRGAGAYICGEETSLLASIEGRRPEVDVRPPFPAEQGLYQQPTIVNNVESFAAIPVIVRRGGEQFANLGTAASTGTKLLSLDSHFVTPGIYEVEMGFPLSDLVDAAGGFRLPVKALHIGGPLGGLVPVTRIPDLTIDFESFDSAGFLLGHAGVVSIPENFPMLDYLAHLFEFTANESCGKCFPCRLGSVRGLEMMAAARNGKSINRDLLEDLLETMELGSLCALGGGLPLPIRNALTYFDDELKQHMCRESVSG